MEKTKKHSKKQPNKSEFYEVMPGYAENPSLFSSPDEVDRQEDIEIRQKMLRQVAILSGLLVIQLVLFAILFQLTVNLG